MIYNHSISPVLFISVQITETLNLPFKKKKFNILQIALNLKLFTV